MPTESDSSTTPHWEDTTDPEWAIGEAAKKALRTEHTMATPTGSHQDRLRRAYTILSDLDRNEHGRHKGDVDASDPTGWSQGNPFALDPETRIGTTMLGEPITWGDLFEAGGPRR